MVAHEVSQITLFASNARHIIVMCVIFYMYVESFYTNIVDFTYYYCVTDMLLHC